MITRKITFFSVLTAAILLLGHAKAGSAAVIDLAKYDLSNATFTEATDPAVPGNLVSGSGKLGTWAASTTGTGVTASVLDAAPLIKQYVPAESGQTRGSVISSTGGNPAPGMFIRSTLTSSTLADAVSNGSYLTITVQATSGLDALKITEFKFDYALQKSDGGNLNGTATLRSSADGFTSNLGTTTLQQTTNNTFAWSVNTYAITAPALQNITGPVEFRLYFHDDRSDYPSIHRLDNFIVRGELIPIPEPAGLSLMGLASVLLLRRSKLARQ
jgi:hypothetical protein